jgi:outer membrane lipoprotein-sorting protein
MSVFSSPGKSKRGARSVGRTSLLLLAISYLSFSSPALASDAGTKAGAKKAETKKAGTRKVDAGTKAPRLSAAEIVRKHVSARGGLQAWRAVQSLSMSGTMEAGTGDSIARSARMVQGSANRKARRVAASAREEEAPKQVQLPFTLAKQRPNKSRLEIAFAGQTAVQVYDGKNGWKLRPYLNRNDVEPFTLEEAKAEAESDDLADPLIDHAARGTKVELDGVEPVDGHAAYKLKLTTRTGTVRHVWIDAKSFLDVKVEGVPRRMDGKLHGVWVYQRDFRSVQGLKIPFVLETAVDGYPQTHKILFQKVAVNPKLDAAAFAKPKA